MESTQLITVSPASLSASLLLWFLLIAILPGLFVPNCPLLIACGSVLTSAHSTGLAVAVAVGAVNANILWTYWFAASPFGQTMRHSINRRAALLLDDPIAFTERKVTWITFLLHVTPGVPLFIQNYFPGLHRLPFYKYLAIAVPIQSLYTTLIIITSGQVFAALKSYPLATLTILGAVALLWIYQRRCSKTKSPAT